MSGETMRRDSLLDELARYVMVHGGADRHDLLIEIGEMKRALGSAMYCLNPNQGEPADPGNANAWLRTLLPADHPSYLSREEVIGIYGHGYADRK